MNDDKFISMNDMNNKPKKETVDSIPSSLFDVNDNDASTSNNININDSTFNKEISHPLSNIGGKDGLKYRINKNEINREIIDNGQRTKQLQYAPNLHEKIKKLNN